MYLVIFKKNLLRVRMTDGAGANKLFFKFVKSQKEHWRKKKIKDLEEKEKNIK